MAHMLCRNVLKGRYSCLGLMKAMSTNENPRVFLKIEADNKELGTVVCEVCQSAGVNLGLML